jgi:hypothetical protein
MLGNFKNKEKLTNCFGGPNIAAGGIPGIPIGIIPGIDSGICRP